MKFRKKLKKYPSKGNLITCTYPCYCRVRITGSSKHRDITQRQFNFTVISVNNPENSIFVGRTDYGFLNEFPQFAKVYQEELEKREEKLNSRLN